MIINCRKIARKITKEVRNEIDGLRADGRALGSIACVEWCGAGTSFPVQLGAAANSIGVDFQLVSLAEDAGTEFAWAEICKLARSENCGGIVVSRQMPKGVDVRRVLDAVPPSKDIDCVHENNRGLIDDFPEAEFLPPAIGAARSVFQKLGLTGNYLWDKKVVFVGKGFSICRPIHMWLVSIGVFYLHIIDTTTTTIQKKDLLASADIVICGAATDEVLVTGEMIKSGAIVLDYGAPTPNADVASIHKAGGKVTPNPGGMGPLVLARMLKNYWILNSGIEE